MNKIILFILSILVNIAYCSFSGMMVHRQMVIPGTLMNDK